MKERSSRPGHTVQALAAMAGVSVRTLHHYDAIGLLRPAHVGTNGYRYYGRTELLRLQQIVLHRRLGMSLPEIAGVLDAPDFDHAAALEQQRARLIEEGARVAAMVATIDRTLASIRGEKTMTDADLYSGFVPPAKQAAHEAWLVERYGADAEGWIAEAKARPTPSAADTAASMAALRDAETALADCLRRGVPADSAALDAPIERHRAWVSASWGRACPPAAYANLADVYRHPDFVARYEAIEPGFADYLVAAMQARAARQGVGGEGAA